MLILSNTTDNIQAVLGGSVTTNQMQCFASWRDITTTAFTPDRTVISTNNTTDVNIVPAPASSTQRVVDFILIYNADTVAQTLTVKFDANGTEYIVWKGALLSGERLEYQEGAGFNVLNSSGVRKLITNTVAPTSSVLVPPHFSTANLTATKTITSNSSFAVYLGKAPRSLTSIQLRLRVTTAAATITWAEVAIAKGSINVGGNPSLTVVGFADVSAVVNSTGQKTITVNVSSGQVVNEGDDLWVLVGNQATTALVIRAQSIADDIQTGLQGSAAQRPSLIVGVSTAFTIESATALAGWINGVI